MHLKHDKTINKTLLPSLQPPLSPLSYPHQPPSPILPQALLIFSMADCCFCCCKLSHQCALIAPLHPQHPLRYTWLWRLIPPFSPLFIPDWEGRREKSITVPSGAGSGVNEVLDKCVRGRKRVREGKKCLFACVCVFVREYMSVLYKEWSRETEWPKASWVQVSGLSGIKFMTIDRYCVCVRWWWMCVCVFGSWWNLTEVRSHHIKPIMAKQANETNESHEMS